jgi:hypothetical protein
MNVKQSLKTLNGREKAFPSADLFQALKIRNVLVTLTLTLTE